MPNRMLKQWALRHLFGYHFNLQEHETSHVHTATYLPLIVADQAKTDAIATAVQVNRGSDTYEGIVNTPMCHMNSVINNIKITEYCMISTAADVPDLLYFKAIMSWGLGDVDVAAPDGSTLISKLQMTKGGDHILPTYTAGADLEHANLVHADIDTLDTNQLLEGVALTPVTLRNLQNDELGEKTKAMMDGPFINRVHKDFPYFREAWYRVPGRTKRMGPFQGCFLYVGVNQALADGVANTAAVGINAHFDDDLTIDEEPLNCHYVIEYNEYNDAFDQTG